MSLLREIQQDAVDSTKPLGDLLRKCKILAYRLGHEDFKSWVESELDGYRKDQDIPSYRIANAESFGDFAGPFQSGLRNASIPPSCVPEKFREIATTVSFTEGIAALENLVKGKKGGLLRSSFPPDLVPHLRVYKDMNCMDAWRQIAPGSVISILDNVRNKVLNFALEIEAKDPAAGEAMPNQQSLSKESVTQIFNMVINGGVVAAGGHNFSQVSISVKKGDLDSLLEFLESKGVEQSDSKEVAEAIKADPPPNKAGHFGKRVTAWVGKMVSKTASGAWKVATDEGAKLLMAAIKQYYGL